MNLLRSLAAAGRGHRRSRSALARDCSKETTPLTPPARAHVLGDPRRGSSADTDRRRPRQPTAKPCDLAPAEDLIARRHAELAFADDDFEAVSWWPPRSAREQPTSASSAPRATRPASCTWSRCHTSPCTTRPQALATLHDLLAARGARSHASVAGRRQPDRPGGARRRPARGWSARDRTTSTGPSPAPCWTSAVHELATEFVRDDLRAPAAHTPRPSASAWSRRSSPDDMDAFEGPAPTQPGPRAGRAGSTHAARCRTRRRRCGPGRRAPAARADLTAAAAAERRGR